jgi:hypothetical protein
MRTLLSGQTKEQFGEGQRHLLTKDMTVQLRRHIAVLRNTDISGYKFERRHSSYPGAKSDIVIYDAGDKPAFFGREMDGHLSFWAT